MRGGIQQKKVTDERPEVKSAKQARLGIVLQLFGPGLMKREDIPGKVSRLIDGRPTRWVSKNMLVTDYDGHERTLEVFNADPEDQRRLLKEIDCEIEALERAVGGPIVIIFHSVKQSETCRHRDFVRSFQRPIP